jgi:hypothetical protein
MGITEIKSICEGITKQPHRGLEPAIDFGMLYHYPFSASLRDNRDRTIKAMIPEYIPFVALEVTQNKYNGWYLKVLTIDGQIGLVFLCLKDLKKV